MADSDTRFSALEDALARFCDAYMEFLALVEARLHSMEVKTDAILEIVAKTAGHAPWCSAASMPDDPDQSADPGGAPSSVVSSPVSFSIATPLGGSPQSSLCGESPSARHLDFDVASSTPADCQSVDGTGFSPGFLADVSKFVATLTPSPTTTPASFPAVGSGGGDSAPVLAERICPITSFEAQAAASAGPIFSDPAQPLRPIQEEAPVAQPTLGDQQLAPAMPAPTDVAADSEPLRQLQAVYAAVVKAAADAAAQQSPGSPHRSPYDDEVLAFLSSDDQDKCDLIHPCAASLQYHEWSNIPRGTCTLLQVLARGADYMAMEFLDQRAVTRAIEDGSLERAHKWAVWFSERRRRKGTKSPKKWTSPGSW